MVMRFSTDDEVFFFACCCFRRYFVCLLHDEVLVYCLLLFPSLFCVAFGVGPSTSLLALSLGGACIGVDVSRVCSLPIGRARMSFPCKSLIFFFFCFFDSVLSPLLLSVFALSLVCVCVWLCVCLFCTG